MRAVHAIAAADFRERIRRTSFLALLAVTVGAAYAFVPARSAAYVTFSFGHHGGIYNSAWIGTLVAILDMVFLSLFGFYVVRDSVERDERTGVGQILATTPMTRTQYTLGKFLSNAAVLASVAAVTLLVAALMQELRGEARRLEPLKLALPFVLLVLPGVALVSALAVLFETLRPLRGAKGGILYFFLWIFALSLSATKGASSYKPWLDPFGWSEPLRVIQAAVLAHFPDYDGVSTSVGVTVTHVPMRTFAWEGLDWARIVPWRVLWLLVAIALAATAALPFHRFDPERMRRRATSSGRSAGRVRRQRWRWVPFVERLAGHSKGFPLVWAELALLLRERRRGWGWVAAGLWVACLFAPLEVVRHFLLPAAWVWPLAAWAEMGNQEVLHRTEALVFVCPRPLRRQLPAAYAAGLLLTAMVGSGAALHFLAARAWGELLGWAAGVLFIPALALAAGVMSGGPRLFEVLYLLVWYMGLLNGMPLLDFLAPHPLASVCFLLAALGLLLLALASRARRLARA